MYKQRVAMLLTAASVALVATGCGGDGSDIIEGDTSFSGVGGQGGQGGTGGGGTGNPGSGGNDGGNSGGDDSNNDNPGAGQIGDPLLEETPPGDQTGAGAMGAFIFDGNQYPLSGEILGSSGSSSGMSAQVATIEGPLSASVGQAIQRGTPGNCPTGTSNIEGASVAIIDGTEPFPICRIDQNSVGNPGSQPDNINLTRGYVYYLSGPVRIGNGFTENATADSVDNITVNIEDGTQIYADPNVSSQLGGSYLRITRGSTINVMGTEQRPVIMTAGALVNNTIEEPLDFTQVGAWGGLLLNGYAPTNADGLDGGAVPNESISEAAPAEQSNYFGGGDTGDSSGEIHYLVIGETGVAIRTDQEVQGITMEGVGSGTEVDHVQVFGSNDDGIEFFGGNVNVQFVLIQGVEDDGLDMDLGYQGTIKNAIVIQSTIRGNRTIEADGNGNGFDFTPRTSPNLANVLLLGAGDQQEGSAGAMLREGFAGDFENSVVTDLRSVSGLNVNLNQTNVGDTYTNGCFINRDVVAADLQAAGLAFYCRNDAPNGVPGEAAVSDNEYPTWYNGMFDDESGSGDTMGGFRGMEDTGITVDRESLIVTAPNFSPVSSGTNDGFQADTGYLGAVDPSTEGEEWFRGWIINIANVR